MKNSNVIVVFLGIIVVFLLGVVLRELSTVLLPFVIALLLSIIFKPILLYLKAKRVPVALALFGVLLAFFLVLFLAGLILFSTADSFIQELPGYEEKLRRMLSHLMLNVETFGAQYGIATEEINWMEAIQFSSLTAGFTSILGSFFTFLSTTFLVLLFMLFILAGSGELAEKVKGAFSSSYADSIARMIENTDAQVRQYLVTKTLISLGTGLITFVMLMILGVDFALIWGFLAFLLNYIPNIGSLVAVIFPFTLSLLQFDTPLRPMLVLILLGGTQVMMGNVLEPKIMSFNLNLSPLLILVSLIFWGWLWGIWGMILAVPLTATIKIIFENIEPTRSLSVLMSGNPPPANA